jgi:cold shock CspA family protein/ribosome-associated translation inhibitor RaiA
VTVPVEVTFHGFPTSPTVEDAIRRRTAQLERFHSRITHCRVVVESPHRHHAKGKLYHLRIVISVPGGQIVVSEEGHDRHAHEDVYVAIRDAFNAVDRKLEDFVRRQRGDVKHHEAPSHGRIARLFPDYGFIADSEGNEIYFHRNSLVDSPFEGLMEGEDVRFVAVHGESERGPQASTVRRIGKHHVVDKG